MVFISKLVTALLLPPGCIIILLFLITLFIPRRYKFFTGLLTLFIYLLSIEPVADKFLLPIEDTCPPLAANETGHEPEAIVVLGGGTVQNSPETSAAAQRTLSLLGRGSTPETGKGDTLSPDALKRAVHAFALQKDFYLPIVFSGGRVFDYGQEPEAVTAARVFALFGLPSNRIIAETKSRNTWENARETSKLGFKCVILVTSAYHMPRSVFCFENNGISVIPSPTDYKCDRGRRYGFFSFMPSMSSMQLTYLALHEYIGLWSYRILYQRKH